MYETVFTTDIEEEVAESLVSAARTSLGDMLRSVVYFTPSSFDLLYLRQDLSDSPQRVRAAKSQLVDLERIGFAEAPARTAISAQGDGSTIGPYEFTVRFHESGFVARVIVGDCGVLLTTDSLTVSAFEEAISAVERLLADQ